MLPVTAVIVLIAAAFLVGWRVLPFVSGKSAASATPSGVIDDDPGRRAAHALRDDAIDSSVTANLRDAIRRYGPASKQAREIFSFAYGICGDIALNPQQRPIHPKPDRAWAWAKLDAECAQFRAQARGLYPHQAEYGNMTHEQLALAFNLAARLRTCSAINACGPGSIQTAYACASVGCPPGVSFVDAARRELPPEVYEVALKMRDALVRDAR